MCGAGFFLSNLNNNDITGVFCLWFFILRFALRVFCSVVQSCVHTTDDDDNRGKWNEKKENVNKNV